MTHNYRTTLAGAGLVLAILACNLPFEQIPPPGDVQTAAALTVQAAMSSPSPAPATSVASPSSSPAPRTPSMTSTGSTDETTTITPTYSVPLVTVRESTNCRTGPGEEYDVVITYLTGKELEIAGRYDPGDFWLVKSNESPTGTCWLWGEFVDVAGSYWAVSSVTPPPTATARPPRAPGIVSWEFFCSGGTLNFTAIWGDNANNEAGYRVFRNGEAITELPADTTTFTDNYDIDENESVEYYLQVFGPSGTANSSIMRMRCGT
ncbi:MAG TPA: SH3 domain-containing protein [Anaerolineales bacterium]|nr:SH3 domain-containing protein [Anaerolineales bacterium]